MDQQLSLSMMVLLNKLHTNKWTINLSMDNQTLIMVKDLSMDNQINLSMDNQTNTGNQLWTHTANLYLLSLDMAILNIDCFQKRNEANEI